MVLRVASVAVWKSHVAPATNCDKKSIIFTYIVETSCFNLFMQNFSMNPTCVQGEGNAVAKLGCVVGFKTSIENEVV